MTLTLTISFTKVLRYLKKKGLQSRAAKKLLTLTGLGGK